MNRAFNSRMVTKMLRYKEGEGTFNEYNEYVRGNIVISTFFGVVLAGNKFSQFDEGIARVATEGGERFSDYRTLYVQDRFPRLKMNDKIKFRDTYYNVLQESDEAIFGFNSYILEKPKDWSPYDLEEEALIVRHLDFPVTHGGVQVTHLA